jgi:hypothetical protein
MSPNGCTGVPNGGTTPSGRSYSFLGACNSHDLCYSFSGSSQTHCDQTFLSNLYQICDDEFGSAATVLGLPNVARASCRIHAGAMGIGVTIVGAPWFNQALNDSVCNQFNDAHDQNNC